MYGPKARRNQSTISIKSTLDKRADIVCYDDAEDKLDYSGRRAMCQSIVRVDAIEGVVCAHVVF